MKFLKRLIGTLAIISLADLVITGDVVVAIPLLAFSSASLGILIGQKIERDKRK